MVPRWKRIPGMQFDFTAAKRSAPTLDNYEGDLLGLFGNYDGTTGQLDAKFDPDFSLLFWTAGLERCARQCFMASGESTMEKPSLYRVTHQVGPNLPLTSKQKFRFSVRPMY